MPGERRVIRAAVELDAEACAAIYAPYVTDTAVTFESDPPSPAAMAERGFRTLVAGMALPNDASVALHRSLGFEPVGTFRRVGWKHGRWHDVAWVQRAIGSGPDNGTDDGVPAELR